MPFSGWPRCTRGAALENRASAFPAAWPLSAPFLSASSSLCFKTSLSPSSSHGLLPQNVVLVASACFGPCGFCCASRSALPAALQLGTPLSHSMGQLLLGRAGMGSCDGTQGCLSLQSPQGCGGAGHRIPQSVTHFGMNPYQSMDPSL